jgi:hypothetical protein
MVAERASLFCGVSSIEKLCNVKNSVFLKVGTHL